MVFVSWFVRCDGKYKVTNKKLNWMAGFFRFPIMHFAFWIDR